MTIIVYHIVFAPKYRRKAFYGSNRAEKINAYITNQLREDEISD